MATSASWRALLAEFLLQWPRVLVLLAVGTLLGYVLAPRLPLYHRAEVPLEVRLDYDRLVYFPPELLYIHTERLREVMEAPEVLERVYATLPASMQAAYSGPEALARSLTVDWRLTRAWFLVAYARGEVQARTLVETWARVLQEEIPRWQENTRAYHTWKRRETLALWESLRLRRWEQGVARARAFFQAWLGEGEPSAPLSAWEREQVLFWAAFAAYPPQDDVLDPAPGPEAPRRAYRRWVREAVLPRLEALADWLPQAREALEQEREQARQQRLALEETTLTLWLPVEIRVGTTTQVYGVPDRYAGALLGGVAALVLAAVGVLARASIHRGEGP